MIPNKVQWTLYIANVQCTQTQWFSNLSDCLNFSLGVNVLLLCLQFLWRWTSIDEYSLYQHWFSYPWFQSRLEKYILYMHGYPHSLMMSSNRTKILSLNQDLCMYIRWNLCDTKHLIYLLLRQTRYKLCTCRMYVHVECM